MKKSDGYKKIFLSGFGPAAGKTGRLPDPHHKICLRGLGLAAAAAFMFPLTALAEYATYPDTSEEPVSVGSYVSTSRGFWYTDEKWDALEDSALNYDEIADLVHNYNSTVITNRADLSNDERRSMDSQEVTEYLLDKADDYDNDADAIEDTSATLAASYRSSANSLRREADSNLEDYDTIVLSYKEIEAETALAARNQFFSYYNALAQISYDEGYLEYLERSYNSALNLMDNQMATELEVLTAREALEDARASAVSNQYAAEEARISLIVYCGWKYSDNPLIGALPEMTPEEAADVDYAEDKAKALDNNYTLQMDQIRLTNASSYNYYTLEDEQKDQIKQDTDSFGISFKAAYDSLINAVNSYNNALTAKANSDQDLAYANQQYELGTISALDLAGVVNTNNAEQLALESAYISMLSARATYDAAVNDGII